MHMEKFNGSAAEAEKEEDKSENPPTTDGADQKLLNVDRGRRVKLSGPGRTSSKGNWTKEEDEMLRSAVQQFNGKCWNGIAKCLPGRTDVQCLHRWQKVIRPDLNKGPWSKEEDDVLTELIGKHGNRKWSEVANHLPGRIGKQCRDRWHNHLNPEINKATWTKEEDAILIKAHAEFGNKWAELAKLLPGRPENSIKNRWHCSLSKKLANSCNLDVAVRNPDRTQSHPMKLPLSTKVFGQGYDHKNENVDYLPERVSCEHQLRFNIPSDEIHNGRNILTDIGKEAFSCSFLPMEKSCRCDCIQALTDKSYLGLCYEPLGEDDMRNFMSTGRFPSTDSYIRLPQEGGSTLTSHINVHPVSYISLKAMLKAAATSFHNVPSIIRKRAIEISQSPCDDISLADKSMGGYLKSS